MFQFNYIPLYLDVGIPFLSVLLSLVMLIRQPRNRQRELFFVCTIGMFVLGTVGSLIFDFITKTTRFDYDEYLYVTDKLFGEPSFFVGKLYARVPQLWLISRAAYTTLAGAMSILLTSCFLLRPLREALLLMRVLVLNIVFALLFYVLVPACGPRYAFEGFPWTAPTFATPSLLHLSAAPNAMPSVHTASVLLIWYFGRHWRIGRVISGVYGLLIFWYVLGTGEHYFIDMVAAVPYTAGLLWLAGSLKVVRTGTKMPVSTATEVTFVSRILFIIDRYHERNEEFDS